MPKLHRFLILSIAAFVFAIPAFAADWPAFVLQRFHGDTAADRMGTAIANVRDLDLDGYNDFILGAPSGAEQHPPFNVAGNGFIKVVSGRGDSVIYLKTGATQGDQFGFSVAGGIDLNSDDPFFPPDFIVGAPGVDPGGQDSAGSVYLYSGADGSLVYRKDGTQAHQLFGYSVAAVGRQFGGPEGGNLLVGSPTNDTGSLVDNGSVYFYRGRDGTLLFQRDGAASGDQFGFSVSNGGNIGLGGPSSGLIVGAPSADTSFFIDAGSVYVYDGNGTLLFKKNGSFGNENFGWSVSTVGDLNFDGTDDFAVGAPGYTVGSTTVGAVFVYSGQTGNSIFQITSTAFSAFGLSLAPAGDVNGDGWPDILVGNTRNSGLNATAMVYSGRDGSPLVRNNSEPNAFFAGSVVGLGDLNGDGRSEFLIGNPFTCVPICDPFHEKAGTVFLFQSGYGEDIQSVSDVGNDQGRQVRIQWKSLPGNDNFVKQFAIYRRVEIAFGLGYDPFKLTNLPPGNWDYVSSIPARGDTLYNTIVPTLGDSTIAGGMHWSVFFVTALGENPVDHFDSPLDSGYSLDNLVPVAPGALAALGTCQGNQLSCSAPVDEDFQYFKIYRDVSSDFSTPVVVGNTVDSFFVDAAPTGQTFYYRVRAVDFSGNEGNFSPLASALAGLKGDLNSSGDYSGADIVSLVYAVFNSVPFPAPFCAADLNCSGNLSGADIVLELYLVFQQIPVTCTP